MIDLRVNQHATLPEIAKHLKQNGYRTRNGRLTWTATTIMRILKRAGVYVPYRKG